MLFCVYFYLDIISAISFKVGGVVREHGGDVVSQHGGDDIGIVYLLATHGKVLHQLHQFTRNGRVLGVIIYTDQISVPKSDF